MLRIVAVLLMLSAAPASAQTIIDGSGSGFAPDQISKLLFAARNNPYLGPNSQIRRLQSLKNFNTVYICGEATVSGGWQRFYYETTVGAIGVGERAMVMCAR
jgi:hypothetical protein